MSYFPIINLFNKVARRLSKKLDIDKRNTMKKLLIIMACISFPLFAQTTIEEPELSYVEIGGVTGWNSPFGTGIQLGYLPSQNIVINAGGGISMAGFKYGIGFKYLLKPNEKISPFLGVTYYHTGGIDSLQVTSDSDSDSGSDSTYYDITAGHTAQIRGGIRIALNMFDVYCTGGYGVALSGGKSRHVSGVESSKSKTISGLFEPNGIEFSVGLVFKLFG
jgi:hypothetical protein